VFVLFRAVFLGAYLSVIAANGYSCILRACGPLPSWSSAFPEGRLADFAPAKSAFPLGGIPLGGIPPSMAVTAGS